MSRAADRAGFTLPVRIRLAEGDVDTLEQGQKDLVEAINSLKRVMMAMLVSVTTASILLAANALLLRG